MQETASGKNTMVPEINAGNHMYLVLEWNKKCSQGEKKWKTIPSVISKKGRIPTHE